MKKKNLRDIILISITVMIVFFISSCSGSNIGSNGINAVNESGAYLIGYNNYLYYYKFGSELADLYRYNLTDGTEEYVDSMTHPVMVFSGIVKMYMIDDRLYYGKSTEKSDVVDIYSVNVNDLQPRFEGSINEIINAHYAEYVEQEFKIFKVKDKVYVLTNYNIYELNGGVSNCVYEGVCGICVNGDKIYYSLFVEGTNDSTGIMCYDTVNNTNTEIINAEEVKEYNKTNTILGNSCMIQNIFIDDDSLYFLATDNPSDIYKYDLNGKSNLYTITEGAKTRLFRKQGDTLYYINLHHQLCSVKTDGSDQKNITQNEYVFSFNVYQDKIYYYLTVDDRGYPAGIIKMDILSGEKEVLLKFE